MYVELSYAYGLMYIFALRRGGGPAPPGPPPPLGPPGGGAWYTAF